MTVTVETLEKLERKITLTLPAQTIQSEVDARLRKLARTIKMDGFRPGKVPLGTVAQRYGYSVYHEVMNDKLGAAFATAANEAQLRVAGQPRITESETASEGMVAFDAVFEIYPDVQLPDLATLELTKFDAEVSDTAIDKTIEILRKQRRTFTPRPQTEGAQNSDRVTVDFEGKIDGEPFAGGKADDFQFILGDSQMLKEFEDATLGMKPGESKTFQLNFPQDYHGKDVAGKTADFMVSVKHIEAAQLPAVDQAFAQSLGIADPSIDNLRADIQKNLQREIQLRLTARNKKNAMDVLQAGATLELPKSVTQAELDRMVQLAREELKERGVKDPSKLSIPEDMFRPEAERRVRLGLILAELVRSQSLQAKFEQVKDYIENLASSYENPAEVVHWYMGNKQKLAEVESLVTENNVAEFVFARAKVTPQTISFEELMERS